MMSNQNDSFLNSGRSAARESSNNKKELLANQYKQIIFNEEEDGPVTLSIQVLQGKIYR